MEKVISNKLKQSEHMQNIGSTVLVVPFKVQQSVRNKLINSPLCTETNEKFVSTVHYLPFVNNHCIGNSKPNEARFLSFYNLHAFDEIIGKECDLVTNGRIQCGLKFFQPLIVFNNTLFEDFKTEEPVSIGYVVFRLVWCGTENIEQLTDKLYLTRALRYHGFDDVKDCKLDISLNNQKYNLAEETIGGFKSHEVSLDWLGDKFICLHFFNRNTTLSDTQIYQLLRYPPTSHEFEFDEIKRSAIPYLGRSAVLNEGALVFDGQILGEMFNKYFPAFLIALNQREVFKLRIEIMAAFASNRREYLMTSANSQLKDMTLTRVQQEFYHVSDATEISLFFSELQRVFSIELLIRDVKDSVEALHSLNEITSSRRLNTALLILGFLSVLSAVTDALDLFGLSTIHLGFKMLVLLTIFSSTAFFALKGKI